MGRRIALSITLAAMIVGALSSVPARASTSSDESSFVRLINSARSSRGLRTLAVRSDLTSVARRHSQDMASSGGIYHNSRLSSQVSGWRELGENVGTGRDVSKVHDAFMNSSSHRANILHATFNEIGVGVVRSGDVIYVTEVFARRGSTTTTTRVTTTSSTRRTATSSSMATSRRASTPVAPKPLAPVVNPPSRAVAMVADLAAMDAFVAPRDEVLLPLAA